MAVLTLLNSKSGFALIGFVLLGLMYGYFTLKIAGINALHNIEISKLTATIEKQKVEVETQKGLAILNGKKNDVCQLDMKMIIDRVDEYKRQINKMKTDQELKTKKANEGALSYLRSKDEINKLTHGDPTPVETNSYMDKLFGTGKI